MRISVGLGTLTVAWLACGAAMASTRFDMVFTSLTSTDGPTTPASGVGYVLVDGYTGSGLEVFGGADLSRKITDFKIDLELVDLGFSNAAPGFPVLTVDGGTPKTFLHNAILIGAPPPTPYVVQFDSYGARGYQLSVTGHLYTGTYAITRYDPPPLPPVETPPEVDAAPPVSPVPEPSVWATMICGFFALGAALRAARRRRPARAL